MELYVSMKMLIDMISDIEPAKGPALLSHLRFHAEQAGVVVSGHKHNRLLPAQSIQFGHASILVGNRQR